MQITKRITIDFVVTEEVLFEREVESEAAIKKKAKRIICDSVPVYESDVNVYIEDVE